jgi:hypothetical protein
MIEAIQTTTHPVGISHFIDGHIPNGRYPNPTASQETVYLQPTIQLQEVPKGAEVEASEDQSICQRLSAAQPSEELRNWFDQHKKTLGWIAGGYLAFRILTRRR